MKKYLLGQVAFIFVSVYSYAQVGKVGINTTTPQAMLHVTDSSVLFTGLTNLPVIPGNTPVNGAGIRMMWYPDKAAFRAGRVYTLAAANWDKDSVGVYSVATGFNSKAKGESSVAMGYYADALGAYSMATGNSTTASGSNSTATGNITTASGTSSTAMGNGAEASGHFSTAMGYYTEASGENSTALGNFTVASGNNSVAMGVFTDAIANNSTAMGIFSRAIGHTSTAMGNSTVASGSSSTSMGYNNTARAYGSVVMGRYNDSISTSSQTNWVDTDPLFIVGNGTDNDTRNNALVIYKNGNTLLDGKLARPSTGAANNLLPICYGSVSNTGAINSGTSNFSVTHSATGQFDIDIDAETYSNSNYVTNVTVSNFSSVRIATTSAASGKLIVKIWDGAGNEVNAGFHFIVYKQ